MATTKETMTVQVTPSDVTLRLDLFLSKSLPNLTRARISKLIKSGLVKKNGSGVKPSYQVALNDCFEIVEPEVKKATIAPQNIPLDILFSDDHIAVINKPCGMTVHSGAGVTDGTLCNALLYHFPTMVVGDQERPGIVHRLDKETAGVMVIAKTHEAHQRLSDDFKHRRVTKIYRAFCWGELPKRQFELKTGHARHPHNRLKYFTRLEAPKVPTSNVRIAHTGFVVTASGFGISEVQAFLYTGRTHQIRAHLSDSNHPLLGDEVYGGKRPLPKSMPKALQAAINALTGQALFAETLAFNHPITKELLRFTAPLPQKLAVIREYLN